MNQREERDFFKNMPVAYAVFRVAYARSGHFDDVVFVYVNEEGARIGGYECEELLGRSIRCIFPDVDDAILATFRATATEGASQHFTHRTSDERYLAFQTYQPEPGYCACVMHDVTEHVRRDVAHKEERRRLEHEAKRDPLTGLYNVRHARQLVERELAQPRWKGARGALFMFDLDDFKQVNDECGHDCGDEVLKGFARTLERSFRRSDIVFRIGGDEFSAFAPDIPCACVAERICSDVVAGVKALDAAGVGVSVSVGVAIGRSTRSYDEFYRAADQALYRIKRAGKSAWLISDMDDVAARDVQGPFTLLSEADKDRTESDSTKKLPAA